MAGVNRSTYYNWRKNGPDGGIDRRTLNTKDNPNRPALPWQIPQEEREQIRAVANSSRYADLSPNKLHYQYMLDHRDMLCSCRSLYRILGEKDLVKDRSGTKERKPSPVPPHGYIAYAPLQVLTWDITYIKQDCKGRFVYLYTVQDLFSRYILGHEVFYEQDSDRSKSFLQGVFDKWGLKGTGVVLHADNGTPMKAANVRDLFKEYGIIESHSRPHVSDDNPFIESFFKVLKYTYGLGKEVFATRESAMKFVDERVAVYHQMPHSGINNVTPHARFHGLDDEQIACYNESEEAYYKKHPERRKNHKKPIRRHIKAGPVALNASVEQAAMLAELEAAQQGPVEIKIIDLSGEEPTLETLKYDTSDAAIQEAEQAYAKRHPERLRNHKKAGIKHQQLPASMLYADAMEPSPSSAKGAL